MKTMFSFSVAIAASIVSQASVPQSLLPTGISPTEVVVPVLRNDPAASDRVAGQLYYSAQGNAFRGVDNNGNIKSLGSAWSVTGSTASFAGTAAANSIQLNGLASGGFTQTVPASTSSYSIVWPAGQGGANTVLQNDGAGNLSWQAPSSSSGPWISAGGDINYVGGNVGIGTATPTQKLEIEGGGLGVLKVSNSSPDFDSTVLISNNANAHILMLSGNRGGSNGTGSPGNTIFDFRQNHDLIIGASTDNGLGSRANYLTVRGDNGHVGIATVTPTVTLDVNGAIRPGDSATVTNCGLGQSNGEGSMRYDYTNHRMEYCDGTGWVAM